MTERHRIEPPVPLLPCPFDGGPAILELEIDGRFSEKDEIGSVTAYVWCHECGARGPHADGLAYDNDDTAEVNKGASEAWNKAPRAASNGDER
jgi:hypothetical protein